MSYCPCCGEFDRYDDGCCRCKTCPSNPNYCARCGTFIGNAERRAEHDRYGGCPVAVAAS